MGRNCNDILAVKPQTNKKRTIGVVEPRVVVKIPLAKVRDNNNTNANITGSSDFLPSPSLSSLVSEPEGQISNTSTSSRKRQNSDRQSNTVDESEASLSVIELHRHQDTAAIGGNAQED